MIQYTPEETQLILVKAIIDFSTNKILERRNMKVSKINFEIKKEYFKLNINLYNEHDCFKIEFDSPKIIFGYATAIDENRKRLSQLETIRGFLRIKNETKNKELYSKGTRLFLDYYI